MINATTVDAVDKAINAFLNAWRERPEYAGALLTGSQASGTSDAGSDIDLRILYQDDCPLREVGECVLQDQVVSFMAMSSQFFLQSFTRDLKSTCKFEIRRFTVGQVIDDPYGKVALVKKQAEAFYQKPMAGFEPVDDLFECLMLGRRLKVFLEMPKQDAFYHMAYYDLLQRMFLYYATQLKADIPAFIKKWSRYFEQEDYRSVHHFTAFPDQQFVTLFLAAQKLDAEKIVNLYQYLFQQKGGMPETDFMARFDDNAEEAFLYELAKAH